VAKENNAFEVADQVKSEHAKIYKRLQEAAKKAKDEGYVMQDKMESLLEKVVLVLKSSTPRKKTLTPRTLN
jgi:hypothetical protein